MSHIKKSVQEWGIIFYRFAKNRQTRFKSGELSRDQPERIIMQSILNCDCHKPGTKEIQGQFKRMFDGKLIKCTCHYHVPTKTAEAPSMYQVLDQSLSNSPKISSQAKQNADIDVISIADSSAPSEVPNTQVLERVCKL